MCTENMMIVCGIIQNGGSLKPEIEEYTVKQVCGYARCAKCGVEIQLGQRVVSDNKMGWIYHKECE